MKKILFLLLFTVASYGQAVFDEGIQIKNNTTDNTATKVNVQSTDGTINTISKSDLVNVIEVNDVPSLPLIGEVGKIYVVKNLNKIYRWNGTFYSEIFGAKGDKGDKGDQGIQGTQGFKGDTGLTGADGAMGVQGPQGIQGNQGETGLRGIQGEIGPQGPIGFTGQKGADGTGVSIKGSFDNTSQLPASGTAGDAYLISGNLHVWNGTAWVNVGNIQGPQGLIGLTGATGSQGIQGVKGDKGDQGIQGIQGLKGDTGSFNGDLTADQVTETATRKFQTPTQNTFNDATSSIQGQLNSKENAFTKNTAFNKNFGIAVGTVAEGNDSRITNGQTAFSWGNHSGVYLPISANAVSASKWATPRTITIGSTGKAVDGTSNVSWSLAEIGAQPLLTNPITGVGVNGQVSFWNGANSISRDNNFLWDDTNKSLSTGVSITSKANFGGSMVVGSVGTVYMNTVEQIGGLELAGNSDFGSKLYHNNSNDSFAIATRGSSKTWRNQLFISSITNLATFTGNVTAPTFNGALNGNASTADSATKWGGLSASFSGSGTTVSQLLGYDSSVGLAKAFNPAHVRTWLGLGTNAYSSTAYLPLSGGTLSGTIAASPATTDAQLPTLGQVKGITDLKVDKVAGKSLIADSEITRLATVTNQDISGKFDKTGGAISGNVNVTGTVTASPATASNHLVTKAQLDASVTSRPYKVYTALLSQSGTNAPTAVVLENTLGGTVVWARSTDGIYYATSGYRFTDNKTTVFINNHRQDSNVAIECTNNNNVSVSTYGTSTVPFSGVDGRLLNNAIEIRVYPSLE